MKEYNILNLPNENYNNEEDCRKNENNFETEINELEQSESYDVCDSNVVIVDPVKQYLAEIGRIPTLTEQEETKLATKICELRNKMIQRGIIEENKVNNKIIKNKLKAFGIEYSYDLNKVSRIINSMIDNPSITIEKRKKLTTLKIDIEIYLEYEKLTQKFAEANLRLTVSIAKKYAKNLVPFLDLIQEGNIGLKKAIDKFEVNKGYKFSTYATWWIKQSISRYIADTCRTIRVPVHYHETILKVTRFENALEVELGRKPTDQEIVDEYNGKNNRTEKRLTIEKLKQIRVVSQNVVSLQTPVGEEEDSVLGDYIESDEESVEDVTFKKLHKETIIKILDQLKNLEKIVVVLRFALPLEQYVTKKEFVNTLLTRDSLSKEELSNLYTKLCVGQKYLTLEAVGKILNITRERVRQIEAKGLRRLRLPSNSEKLKSLLKG